MAATQIDLSGGTGGAGGQTVYTAPNGVVVTSSAPTYSNGSLYYLGYIFNGNKDTGAATDYWLTNSSGNQTLTFDMDAYANDPITRISVYPKSRTDASSNYSIDVSNDGSSWTEIVPLVTNSTSLALGTERLHDGLNITQRYIRFNLTRNASWGVTLHEIELYEDASAGGGAANDDSYKILGIEPVYMQDFGGVEESATPVSNTAGAQYASAYIGYTSGSIVNHSESDDTSLDSVVDSMSDGDALLLAPGSYTMTKGSTAADIFRAKAILICGDTDEAQEVSVDFNHDLPSATRDHPLFSAYSGITNGDSLQRQWAFVAFKRVQTSGTNYISALLKGSTTTKGKMVNCYIDLNGSDVSWVYDNGNQTTHDVRWHNCTFANYANWDSKYSGWTGANNVYNGLFQKTYQQQASFYGTQVTNATIDTTNRTYNTTTYSSNGHLVIDANYLDYANPV